MKTLLTASALALAAASATAQTEIRVHYAIPTIWADTQAALEQAFEAQHPDIDIVIDGPAESYAEGVQRLLRESVAGTLPDVAWVGLNRWRILEARGLTQPLDPFLPDDPEAAGYTGALLSLGRYQDTQHALGTSASTLVMYVNPDLVEQAGYSMDDFPTDYDGIIALAAAIDDLGGTIDGIWIDRHDWRFQSLLGGYGGRPMTEDESDITFDAEAGKQAAALYARFDIRRGRHEKLYRRPGAAGLSGRTLGIMMDSSSLLKRFTEAAGDSFAVTVVRLPVPEPETAYFPTGGSGIVMLTDDPEKAQAAWEYISFVTGPEGQKIIVENTGYAPTNALLLEDESYLGAYYDANPNARTAHQQVAEFAGPWYAYPGAEGVAVTDLIAAALVEIAEGDVEPGPRIEALADTLRDRLDMN
jgi:multiple sugar transport system substrate-binding protein